MLPSLLIVGLLAGQPRPEPLEDWAGYLRDALTHSQALAREGRAHVYVEYESEHEGKPFKAELEGDIEWSGELLYESYAISSPGYHPFSLSQPDGLRASPPFNMLITNDEIVVYNGISRLLEFTPKAAPTYRPILHLNPTLTWFSTGAGHSRKGRPWKDMLEYRPRDKSGAEAVIAFTREVNEIIRMRRTDPDGFEVVIDFSLRHGGNVVRIESTPSAKITQRHRADYEWVRQGEAYVMQSCRLESNFGGPNNGPYRYRVVYSDVKLGPQDPAQFTVERVKRNIIGRVRVRDHIRNRTYSFSGKAEDAGASFDRLIGVLLSRGFARRGGRL
ncbi:MAG: hypothetical protein SFX72_23080 [Isosphaeraceae bacterium]|nr:hypothetical protein [Isosphaeraceae bacterium]